MSHDTYTDHPLVIGRGALADAATELWDAANNGYATDGYSLAQIHDALWAALRDTISEMLEDITWHATSPHDTTGLRRHLDDALRRLQPAGPPEPPDDEAELDEPPPQPRP